MGCLIREVVTSDYPALESLWQKELGNRRITLATLTWFYTRTAASPEYRTFVAVAEGSVVGFVTTVQVWAADHPEGGYLKINCLAVRTDCQRQGIGRKLMEHAEEYGREKHAPCVLLCSGVKRTGAHVFYESIGYSRDSYCFDKG